jgi:hypothetical protein
MDKTPLEYFAEPGKSIDDACRESLRIANTNRLPVWFDFNGTRVDVEPGMSIIDAANQYFRKRYRPTTETMTDTQKRKAALDAVERCQQYAKDNAATIANDAAMLLAFTKQSGWIYPELSEYVRLRSHADAMMREVLP